MSTVLAESRAIIESLGLKPVINAMGAPSRLGCTVLSPSVRAAMDAAAQHCIPIAEMQERASAVIAQVTGAEAGCVASGAAACLFWGPLRALPERTVRLSIACRTRRDSATRSPFIAPTATRTITRCAGLVLTL